MPRQPCGGCVRTLPDSASFPPSVPQRGADKKPDPFARNRFMDILRDVCLKVKDDATGQEMYQLKPELMNT